MGRACVWNEGMNTDFSWEISWIISTLERLKRKSDVNIAAFIPFWSSYLELVTYSLEVSSSYSADTTLYNTAMSFHTRPVTASSELIASDCNS
jgi:hypothetical protein